jgi:DMSO/TMAO reductase YedYZ heme-binding membrane subunit
VASTRSRPRGREHARPSTGGVAAEHATKIYTVVLVGIVVIVGVLALTSIGHVIDAATQHFMLFYAGVFALIGLCASVGLGLVSTDRMFLQPGHRVFVQAAHRAASFGAVAFLIIHIVTEILAQRVHVLDAVVPFLSPFRTFYIGLGTISFDLLILLAITGIMRGRFNAGGKAWRWRAIHYTSYAAFVFGVWHGLLAGRTGKPYVDWSYGFVIAFVLLGLAIRVLSNSLRPKENLSTPPVDPSASSASAPLRAAAMLAQYGATRGGRNAVLGASTGAQPMLSAPVSATVVATVDEVMSERSYYEPGMSGQPQPYYEPAMSGQPQPYYEPAMSGQPQPYYEPAMSEQPQPYYEPGYEGPPRYLGAPRAEGTGPMPRAATGPMSRPATGPTPRAVTGPPPRATGAMPTAGTGPLPRAATGSFPAAPARPQSRPETGSLPRAATGSFPVAPARPQSRPETGPLPRAATGSFPAAPARPQPWPETGPLPRATGPVPQANNGWGTGPRPRPAVGPVPPGPAPRGVADPRPRGGSGPMPMPTGSGSGPYPRPPTGPMPTGSDPYQRPPTGPMPTGSGPYPRPPTGPMPTGSGPYPRPPTGPMPQAGPSMPPPAYPTRGSGRPGGQEWLETSHDGGWQEQPPWVDAFADTDPDLRFREPGPGMPGYRGAREQRYGGDRY